MNAGLAATTATLIDMRRFNTLLGIREHRFHRCRAFIDTRQAQDAGRSVDDVIIVEPTQLSIAIAHKIKIWVELESLGVSAW